jgi:hypothetical protein
MKEIIENRKLEVETGLKNLMVDKVLMEEQVEQLNMNIDNIKGRILSMRALLTEFNYLEGQIKTVNDKDN